MPSLTECPFGAERSTIRRNFPGWCGFGIIPIGLVCTTPRGGAIVSLFPWTSFCIYVLTVVGFSATDWWFLETHLMILVEAKPILKP